MPPQVIVNPLVFEKLGIKKVYGFIKIDDYWTFKERCKQFFNKNKKISIGIYGIYGYHDILIESYERDQPPDPKLRLVFRLWPIIGGEDIDPRRDIRNFGYFHSDYFGWAIVQKVIKIRGVLIEGNQAIDVHVPTEELEKYKKFYKKIVTRDNVREETIKEMLEKNICVKVKYTYSDKYPSEKDKNEFLILCEVREKREVKENPKDIFNREVLEELKKDERVRTIEELSASEECLIKADYILHIVGKIEDLNEIVLEKIHKTVKSSKDIGVKTMLIFPAERLVENRLPCLSEYELSASEAKIFSSIIDECIKSKVVKPKDLISPLVFLELDKGTRDILKKIYEIYDQLVHDYYNKKSYLRENMLRFLYSTAIAISEMKTSEISERIRNEIRSFILAVNDQIEESLKKVFKNCMESLSLSPKELNELLNYAIEIKSRDAGRFNIDVISVGVVARAISSLEGIFKGKSKLQIDEYKLKKLEKLYNEFRKWFEPEMETEKEIGMKKTTGYLDRFARSSRNVLSHHREKIDLHEMLKGVDCGIRYLKHINKRLKSFNS